MASRQDLFAPNLRLDDRRRVASLQGLQHRAERSIKCRPRASNENWLYCSITAPKSGRRNIKLNATSSTMRHNATIGIGKCLNKRRPGLLRRSDISAIGFCCRLTFPGYRHAAHPCTPFCVLKCRRGIVFSHPLGRFAPNRQANLVFGDGNLGPERHSKNPR